MVDERITDGVRIAQLLASEIRGRTDGALGAFSVVDVSDAEGTIAGEFAYGIARDGETVVEVFVHPDRARLEFSSSPERVLEAADESGVRARPLSEGEHVRVIVFVEDGAEVKRAVDVVRALGG